MTTPEELLCRRSWRLRHGLWMLWGILSFGMLWSVAFAIVGIRAKNRAWLVLAGIWLAFLVGYIAVSSAVDMPAKGEPSTPLSSAVGSAVLVSWVTGSVVAWFVNRKWLVWLAHHGRRGPWYAAANSSPSSDSAPAVSHARAVDDALRASTETRFPSPHSVAPGSRQPLPPSTPAPLTPPPHVSPAPADQLAASTSSMATAPLNLNTATREQLALLPGIDLAWAEHIIATRERVGGFLNPSDLVTAAGLQPHVFAAIRGRVVAVPRAQREPAPGSDGRRLEF